MIRETKTRSVLKGVTWRLFGSLTTFVISYAFTREVAIATGITLFEVVTKVILFYVHERLWIRVPWGLARQAQK